MPWTSQEFLGWLDGRTGELFPDPIVDFAIKVDLVEIGSCSSEREIGWTNHFGREDYRGKTVMLISECCGNYSPEFQRKLREKYPETTWIFPGVWDYCRNLRKGDVLDDLLRLGILKEKSG